MLKSSKYLFYNKTSKELTHVKSDLKLSGEQPSYEMDNTLYYNTNFGQVAIDKCTEDLVSCCIGLGRNQYNTEMTITIYDGEFSVSRNLFNTIYAELCSDGYLYPKNCKQQITILEVLEMLYKDDNDSIAAIIVKKEILKLMYSKLKFGKQELKMFIQMLSSWRRPIVTRTPVRR